LTNLCELIITEHTFHTDEQIVAIVKE